jgi:transcriptional regulator with XRE-family HTH domain
MAPSNKSRLPAEALHLALSRARQRYGLAWDELAERLDISFRTLLRIMSAETVTPDDADRMAVRLGVHPVVLWPEEWLVGAA